MTEKKKIEISETRFDIVANLAADMLKSMAENHLDDPDDYWREQSFDALSLYLFFCGADVSKKLEKIDKKESADFAEAKEACAMLANYAAMIHDKLNGLELEMISSEIKKNKEKARNEKNN